MATTIERPPSEVESPPKTPKRGRNALLIVAVVVFTIIVAGTAAALVSGVFSETPVPTTVPEVAIPVAPTEAIAVTAQSPTTVAPATTVPETTVASTTTTPPPTTVASATTVPPTTAVPAPEPVAPPASGVYLVDPEYYADCIPIPFDASAGIWVIGCNLPQGAEIRSAMHGFVTYGEFGDYSDARHPSGIVRGERFFAGNFSGNAFEVGGSGIDFLPVQDELLRGGEIQVDGVIGVVRDASILVDYGEGSYNVLLAFMVYDPAQALYVGNNPFAREFFSQVDS